MTAEQCMGNISLYYDRRHEELAQHPLYDAIDSIEKLKIFMQHHVFAVWDFMSLIKSLQSHIVPTKTPWIPSKETHYIRLINQLVLDEESDYSFESNDKEKYCSHFESYSNAMAEIGANLNPISQFIDVVKTKDLYYALSDSNIPLPSKEFIKFTFDTIDSNKPHLVASVLAYGRESIIPNIFQGLLSKLNVSRHNAPILYAYLERHIDLDEHEHGPIAIRLVQYLCGVDPEKQSEANYIAERAIDVRLRFWDGIYSELKGSE